MTKTLKEVHFVRGEVLDDGKGMMRNTNSISIFKVDNIIPLWRVQVELALLPRLLPT